MKKNEFVRRVADELGVTIKAADGWVTAIFEILGKCLLDEDVVQIWGFGKFEKRQSKRTTGRNPNTGEKITFEPRKSVKFTPGRYLYYMIKTDMTSEDYEEQIPILRQLRRGESVPGWKLGWGKVHAERVPEGEEVDDF